ncbi:MAG: glycosyltransferase 87 family protein, partial [Micrococcales bacterium]
MIDLQTAKKTFLQRWLLLFAMVACHVWLYWLGQNGVGTPMWDLNNVYAPWVAQMAETHRLLGIDANWIYPFPDIVPLALAAVISPSNYQLGWVVMVAILNLVALGALLGWRSRPNRQSLLAGWFWVAGLVLLGPVSISRLDSVSVAIAVLALAFLVRNKTGTAATLMAIGIWIKIWPLAFFLASVGSREKLKRTWMVGFGTGLSILAVGILIAKPQYLFSFATGQVGRGIQIEAPVATPWLWMGIQNPVESGIRFSQQLLTFQVFGPFTVEFARLMDLVQ